MTTLDHSYAVDDADLLARVGQLLDLDLHSGDDLRRLAASGVSARAFNEFARRLPLPKRLLRSVLHRQRRGGGLRLSPLESEAVLRIARTYALAQLVLSDDHRALAWFTTPAAYLDQYTALSPLELSLTDTGARLIESRLRAHAKASTPDAATDALRPRAGMPPPCSAASARREDDSGPVARL
ncbi:antitoxin Xre/MbcA/ParS toxin-binding domain-containing protein [Cognatilysobacter bugurensis]|uniref:DUF2384 domain-containing protein n=1 Tax=Cognatilysobacter bugurensis TaxID=543356 RepID=A0A918SV00_9GAMM|nr:antitoxin Xre/MbcA/ParS toxin-binding domain-containing protein [Lysobacter bugurensis]GHA72781.1 hypothetical protein GCM10007067_06710 [Lysobacter bugurensis]